jgi:hypothetical protein
MIVPELPTTWLGTTPYVLIIEPVDRAVQTLLVDLDEPGWITTHSAYLRAPGVWTLVGKPESPRAILSMVVLEGEQPYYAARHIGIAGGGGSNEIIAYGIGKKQISGIVMRLWSMPNGSVCGGDDAELIGIAAVRRLGPRG